MAPDIENGAVKLELFLEIKNMSGIFKKLLMFILVLGLTIGIFAEIQIDPGKYTVKYVVRNDWQNGSARGATIDMTITNNGSEPIKDWVVSWSFSGNQNIYDIWRVEHTQSGKSVVAKCLYYDNTIPPNGGQETFGFNINYTGTNSAPSSYALKANVSSGGGTNPTDCLKLDKNGNLGIGVIDALGRLHVASTTTDGIISSVGDAIAIKGTNNSASPIKPTMYLSNDNADGNALIVKSGNVGIGTISPSPMYFLSVIASSSKGGILISSPDANNAEALVVNVQNGMAARFKSTSNSGVPTCMIEKSGSYKNALEVKGGVEIGGGDLYLPVNNIIVKSGNIRIGDIDTILPDVRLHIISTLNSNAAVIKGSSSTYASLNVINPETTNGPGLVVTAVKNAFNGRLVIGGQLSDGTEKLHVVGNIKATGRIYTGSSRSYKDNIRDLDQEIATKTLMDLQPVRFYYKNDKSKEDMGFIAEDVPDLVATKDRKSLSTMDFVALSVKVIQDQQKRIDILEKEIEALKKKIK